MRRRNLARRKLSIIQLQTFMVQTVSDLIFLPLVLWDVWVADLSFGGWLHLSQRAEENFRVAMHYFSAPLQHHWESQIEISINLQSLRLVPNEYWDELEFNSSPAICLNHKETFYLSALSYNVPAPWARVIFQFYSLALSISLFGTLVFKARKSTCETLHENNSWQYRGRKKSKERLRRRPKRCGWCHRGEHSSV